MSKAASGHRAAVTLFVLVVGLSACGSSGTSSGSSVTTETTSSAASTTTTVAATTTAAPTTVAATTTTQATTTTVAETTTTLPPAPDYEKEFETAGLFVTVHDSILSPTLSYMRAGDVPAPDGGVYLYVTTTVRNESDQAIDLTCSLPLWTHAIDEKGRKYDAVEKLYDIKGNPECNASLNPGFSSDVTWVFLVPTTATMTGFRFVNSESIGSNLPELTVRIAPTA